MPKPDSIWIALGMVIWAITQALGPQQRRRFIDALASQAEDQEARRRVVSITAINGRRRALTQSVQVAASFIARIVAEVRAARE